MKNLILSIPLFLSVFLISCANPETMTVTTKAGVPGKKIVLEIVPGPEWTHLLVGLKGAGIMTPPQFSVWAEDQSGALVDTLYITAKYALQNWFGAELRPSTVPYWGFKMAGEGADKPYAPSKDKPLDTITSASPMAGFVLHSTVPDTWNGIVIKAEINVSFDFNEYYRNGLPSNDVYFSGADGDGGQPALVYQALLLPSAGTNWIPLVLMGHSSPSGADGGLYTNLDGLTTALEIVKSIKVRYAE